MNYSEFHLRTLNLAISDSVMPIQKVKIVFFFLREDPLNSFHVLTQHSFPNMFHGEKEVKKAGRRTITSFRFIRRIQFYQMGAAFFFYYLSGFINFTRIHNTVSSDALRQSFLKRLSAAPLRSLLGRRGYHAKS